MCDIFLFYDRLSNHFNLDVLIHYFMFTNTDLFIVWQILYVDLSL